MPTVCASMSRGRMMRLTRLDDCGVPVPGPTGSLVTKGFIQVVATPVYQDQEDITQTDANGDTCVDDQSDPALRWLTLQIDLCNIDPDAVNIITGAPLVVDDATPTPNTTGFRWDTATLGTASFALELWSGISGQGCAVGGNEQYGYWLYPYVVQAQINEYTVANAALTLSMTARTSGGSGWDVGPYDIRRDATTPATLEPLLTPIGPTQHGHFEITSAPLPTPGCGAVELPEPVEP
jgi:hypothetical protein